MTELRRRSLNRLLDIALVAAFLATTAVAYGAFFVTAGGMIGSPGAQQFSDFYLPDRNPWAGTVTEPATGGQRFADGARTPAPRR